jgi:hypothetical protein
MDVRRADRVLLPSLMLRSPQFCRWLIPDPTHF